MIKATPNVRIGMRVEGNWWVAYCCRSMTSMEGAIELGRLRMSLASDPVLKQKFIEFMQASLNVAIKAVGGQGVEKWETRSAPERERSGRA